jgi:trehalose/maltose transport system substrate-binding protein
MSKKTLGFLLVLAMLVSSFSIASADMHGELPVPCPDGAASVTIAGGAVGVELELIDEQIARYMELCPNVTVTSLEMPDGAGDRLALYQQFWEAQSGDVDIYQVDVIWPGIIAEHMVDLNDHLPEDYVEMFFPAMIGGQTIDGRLVAIPWFTDAPGLYYRTDLLEEYGQELPETWDDMAGVAQAIQDGVRADTGNEDFWGFVWQGNAYEGLTCDAHEWITAATGEVFITPEGEVTVNQDAAIHAVERAADWVGTISPPGVTGYQEEESRAVWQAGNAAFMRNWPYAYGLGNADDSVIAGLFDYVPLPVGASGNSAGCLGGWQLGVSRYSANVDAAVSVAAFLASAEEQKLRALSPQGANPTIPHLYDDEELLEANPLFGRMGPILAAAVPRPSGILAERYEEGSRLFYSAVHSVLTGQESAENAMADLELDLEDLLDDIMGG